MNFNTGAIYILYLNKLKSLKVVKSNIDGGGECCPEGGDKME